MNFGFSFFGKLKDVYGNNKSATQFSDVNKSEYLNVYDESQVVRYTTNHDVNSSDGTPQELFGGDKGAMGAFIIPTGIAYLHLPPNTNKLHRLYPRRGFDF